MLGLAAVLLIAIPTWWFLARHVPADRDREIKHSGERLSAMVDDRRFALDSWLSDGLGDARTVARYPTLRHVLGRPTSPSPFPAREGASAHLRQLLRDATAEQHYRSATVVNASGTLVARDSSLPTLGDEAVIAAARQVIRQDEATVDLWRFADGTLGILFGAPVGGGDDGLPLLGALVLDADPESFLFPLLRSEPVPTATGETMLARREGGDAVYLAPTRQASEAPLTLRHSLSTPSFAMRAALDGEERVGPFVDHQGTQVLAATRRLRSVPWGLVAKVDTVEALNLHERRVRAEARAGVLLQLALLGLGVALWKWRSAAEQARLHASRARLALLLDHAHDAILFIGADGRIEETNERAAEFYGMTRDTLVGRHVFELRAEEERPATPVAWEQARTGSLRFETVHLRSDGSRVPVEVNSVAATIEGEAMVVSIVRDVSARKKAEAHLEQVNRLYRTLSEVSGLIAGCSDRALLYEEVCRVLAHTGGFALAWLGLKQPDGRVAVAAGAGSAAAYLDGLEVRWDDTPSGRGPVGLAIREGRAVIVPDLLVDAAFEPWRERAARQSLRTAAAFPLVVGGEISGALMIYASEPRALAEEEQSLVGELARDLGFALQSLSAVRAHRSLEVKLRAVFEGDLIGILLGDIHGRVFDANDTFLETIGYSRAELQSGEVRWDAITPPEHRPRDEEGLAEARKYGSCIPYEKEYVRKDCTRVWVLVGYTLLEPEREQSVAFILDIGERKRLEAQFRQAQKMEAVGRLAGGVAHDFNNLLGVITGYAEMASRQVEPGHPVQARIEQVLKAAERAASLTRQLLAFSRRQILETRVVDLNALLQDLEKMLRRLIGEDVELVVRLEPTLPVVRVDPGQMEQVVMNLAVNARDAMPRGGRLTIETSEADADEIRSAAHWRVGAGLYVRVRVSDLGEGMDDATQARMFEPFFTTKPAGQGTGLGLATVYGIVKQSGGHVVVQSALGQGTAFSIYLPTVAEPVSASASAPPLPLPRAPSGTTVLVVEDQDALREVVREMLEEMGYQVLVASDSQAALSQAREHPGDIHLLLSDVVMPSLSGPELALQVVALRPAIKVLFMSGYSSEQLGHHGADQPGMRVLEKPFTRPALASAVWTALRGTGGL